MRLWKNMSRIANNDHVPMQSFTNWDNQHPFLKYIYFFGPRFDPQIFLFSLWFSLVIIFVFFAQFRIEKTENKIYSLEKNLTWKYFLLTNSKKMQILPWVQMNHIFVLITQFFIQECQVKIDDIIIKVLFVCQRLKIMFKNFFILEYTKPKW